jgi:TnpA family transposase
MTSIERTAYPRFKRSTSARELREAFTPTDDETLWARGLTRTPSHLLGLVVGLKSFQRLGYFPKPDQVPAAVVDHLRDHLQLPGDVGLDHGADRTLARHRDWIRARLGVVYDPQQVRKLAEQTIREAAYSKDNPADLINVALEELIRGRYELPGYTTLDELTARIRTEVNTELFATIGSRLTEADRAMLVGLLKVHPTTKRSDYDRLKQPAKAATLSKFKDHLTYLGWVDGLGPARAWVAGIPPSKVAHFAGEAHVTDVADLGKMGLARRLALVACLLHQAQVRARDEVATMFCKRMAAITKKAKDHLNQLREQHRADTERLLGVFGDVLGAATESLGLTEGEGIDGQADPLPEVCERTGRLVLAALNDAGGIRRLAADHETVSAHHGNNYAPLMEQVYRSHRAALFTLLDVLELQATSADGSVLDAVAFLKTTRRRSGEFIPDHLEDGTPVELSFASEQWQKVLRARRKPGRLVRRHFEVCVFAYLAAELRSGDVAVVGSDAYANLYDQLMSWRECEPLVADYCAAAGIPTDGAAFVELRRAELVEIAERVDAGYPDNADLSIDEHGHPVLKRRKGADRPASALELEAAVNERIPERGLLDVLTRTAYWLDWHRHFGPASGSDPKLRDALARYVLLTFCYGTNLGPAQVARHMRGQVSPHELSTAREHAPAAKLQAASTDVINAFAQLDLPKVWGDGSRVAVDGSQIDTWADSLLAETSIRYGGYGGIAFRHIADSYIALFSRFIPCGVWEAVYIIDGLLHNDSDVQPSEIHADTQGQTLPIFGLARLLGFDLLPRIRNWQDLIFYRPTPQARYQHIDALFGEDAIDWDLIERHWTDLLCTAISVREGRLSSVTLLRRLGNHSRKNRLYRALRELGRAVRTIVLLRFLSEPKLRDSIAVITNRMEAFNGFAQWLAFGHDGVLADNDPEVQEQLVKFNELLANLVIYQFTLDITAAVNQLVAEGFEVDREDLAIVSPYQQGKLRRFGDWVLDLSPPEAGVPTELHLDLTKTEARST